MEKDSKLLHVVTQNVDNLHGKAGSKAVTELHGE
jgi:NAD-dependent SIR2 family protein deacetylase